MVDNARELGREQGEQEAAAREFARTLTPRESRNDDAILLANLRAEIERIISLIEDPTQRGALRSELSGATNLSALHGVYANVALARVRDELQQNWSNIQAIESEDDARRIELSRDIQERIRRQAEYDLSTREGLEGYLAARGVPPEEIGEVADDIETVLGPEGDGTLQVIEDAGTEAEVAATTALEEYLEFARGLRESEDPELRAFGLSIVRHNLHRQDSVQDVLDDLIEGRDVPADRLQGAVTEARREREARRDDARSQGVTNEHSLDEIDQLRAVRRQLGDIGTPHQKITRLAAFDNASFNGQSMSRAERLEHVQEAISSTPTGRNMSAVQVRQLAELQLSNTPRPTREVTEGAIYQREMRAGYDAMLAGDLPGAIQRANNVGDLLRTYGKTDAEANQVTAILIRGAHAGVTDAGKNHLRSIGPVEAIRSQSEIIRTGQSNLVLDTLITLSSAGALVGNGGGGLLDGFARQIGASSYLKQRVERAIDGRTGDRLGNMDRAVAQAIGGRDGMNADEYLAHLERTGIITRRGALSSDAWVEENVRRLDTDGDGLLSNAELLAAARRSVRLSNGVLWQLDNLERLGWTEMQTGNRRQGTFDRNNDGQLTFEEVMQAFDRHGIKLSQLDTNGDGQLSIQEVGRGMHRVAEAEDSRRVTSRR